jgi:abortive infection bacteriophage resistance protein
MEMDTCHNYKSGSTFENAVSLYYFDAQLRHLIFGAIQKIEISLRAKMINIISLQYGAMWFIDSNLAIDKHKFSDNLSTLERELNRSKEEFIKDHITKYGKEEYPPVWKLLELASFGCLTKLYFNFSDNKLKKNIARSYKVPQHEILESWMKSLNVLRNACAHHSRVWNRVMAVMPQLPNSLNGDWITIKPSANKLYAILCCLLYWLNTIDPNNTLKLDLKTLLTKHPNVDPSAMGFPSNWQNEPLWK